jgi:hypothetical protein
VSASSYWGCCTVDSWITYSIENTIFVLSSLLNKIRRDRFQQLPVPSSHFDLFPGVIAQIIDEFLFCCLDAQRGVRQYVLLCEMLECEECNFFYCTNCKLAPCQSPFRLGVHDSNNCPNCQTRTLFVDYVDDCMEYEMSEDCFSEAQL